MPAVGKTEHLLIETHPTHLIQAHEAQALLFSGAQDSAIRADFVLFVSSMGSPVNLASVDAASNKDGHNRYSRHFDTGGLFLGEPHCRIHRGIARTFRPASIDA